MSECLFCRLARGDLPATIVQRAPGLVAFRDVNPQAPTHILVIPTAHVASLNEVGDENLAGRLLLFARDVARDVGLAESGYRVVINTNDDGGQTVLHLHAHVLGGRAMTWPPG